MALVLTLEKRRMPVEIKLIFEEAKKDVVEIFIPSIVFAELAYLSEKNRIETSLKEAKKFLADYKSIKEHPLSMRTVEHSFEINDIPELHDRLIAGSAKELDFPILTNDPVMHSSKFVNCIWNKTEKNE